MIAAIRVFVVLVAVVAGAFLGFFFGIWLCSVLVWEDPELWQEDYDQRRFREWIESPKNRARTAQVSENPDREADPEEDVRVWEPGER